MLTFYIIAAIIGGGLLLVSLLFGGHHGGDGGHDLDAHNDVDLHHELDHDHDHGGHEGHIWLPFLSLRFWTYFMATFGGCGLLLTKYTSIPEPGVSWMSAGSGFAVGLCVAILMRLARRMETSSEASTKDLLGKTAQVLVAIRPGQEGKVRTTIKGDTIEFLALPHESQVLEPGIEVVIVSVENDRVHVVPVAGLLP